MSKAILLAAIIGATPAVATTIEVQVLNVADAAGSVRVQVCERAEWLKDCARTASAKARPGTTVVTVPGVPPGTYGVVAFHDSNDDGDVNQNFIGLPTEGVGFSRRAPLGLTGPAFDDAAVRVAGDRVLVPVTLHFERAASRP